MKKVGLRERRRIYERTMAWRMLERHLSGRFGVSDIQGVFSQGICNKILHHRVVRANLPWLRCVVVLRL